MRIHDYRLEIWYVNLLQVQGFHLWLKLCMHIYSKLWRVMKWRASGSLGLRSRLEGYQLNGETCIVRYCMFCWSCSCKNAKVWEYGDPNLQDVSYGVIFTPFLESFSTSTDSSTTCRNEVLFFFSSRLVFRAILRPLWVRSVESCRVASYVLSSTR
jgi:hypothetical protein